MQPVFDAPMVSDDESEKLNNTKKVDLFSRLIIRAINIILDHLPEEDQLRVLQYVRHQNARESAKLLRQAQERRRSQ